MRVPESKVECGEGTHRQADDMPLVDPQVIQRGLDVVRSKGLRIGSGTLRNVRRGVTSSVECNRAISPAEVPQLRFPASKTPAKLMHKNRGPPLSLSLKEEPDPVFWNGESKKGSIPESQEAKAA